METRFAKLGDEHIAYRVLSDGPIDLLLLLGEYLPVDAVDEEPRYTRVLQRLGSIGRLILFNRRGVGLSDPPPEPLTQEQYVEDAIAVLDAVGSTRATLIASNVSGGPAIQFAVEHPDRTATLILINTTPRYVWADDFPMGIPEESLRSTAERTTTTEASDFDFLSVFAPSVASDARFRQWWDSAGHRGASPTRSRKLWALLYETDVRALLPEITAPTLVIARDRMLYPQAGRYMAERIPGARFVEVPGADQIWWIGDSEPILEEIELFLATTLGSAAKPRRALATVLFVDVVSSTEQAAAMGDRRWREVLGAYHDLVRREVERFDGQQIGTEGDGVLATFPMPADAIRCARAVVEKVKGLGFDVRVGIHTGEIEILGRDVAGIGVHIAARVKELAGEAEILVSRTVAELATGSGFRFADRGEHELRGVPGHWQLFAVP